MKMEWSGKMHSEGGGESGTKAREGRGGGDMVGPVSLDWRKEGMMRLKNQGVEVGE